MHFTYAFISMPICIKNKYPLSKIRALEELFENLKEIDENKLANNCPYLRLLFSWSLFMALLAQS